MLHNQVFLFLVQLLGLDILTLSQRSISGLQELLEEVQAELDLDGITANHQWMISETLLQCGYCKVAWQDEFEVPLQYSNQ